MEGEVFFTGDRQTVTHTDGHRDSMTESAQWADSVKIQFVEHIYLSKVYITLANVTDLVKAVLPYFACPALSLHRLILTDPHVGSRGFPGWLKQQYLVGK